jgi:hypothetical protein
MKIPYLPYLDYVDLLNLCQTNKLYAFICIISYNKTKKSLFKVVLKKNNTYITIYVTHLNHVSEPKRLQEWKIIQSFIDITENHYILGDFNALTKSDYTDNEWSNIAAVRKLSNWEIPTNELTLKISEEYHDCVKEKGFIKSTSRYNTRIDYIYTKQIDLVHHAEILNIEGSDHKPVICLNQILSNYGLHPQHIMTIAYLFFSKGIPTGAMHNSYNKPYGPIDKASVSKAVDILKSSALQGTTHNITGISTSIVFGLEPKVGTGYFDIAYDTGSQILVNKNIYKIFKQQRNQIDLSNNGVTPIDSSNVNNDLNNSLDNYYENTNKLPKILKGKPLTGRKVYPKEEDNPIITDESSEIMKKSVRSTTVKSKYDVI